MLYELLRWRCFIVTYGGARTFQKRSISKGRCVQSSAVLHRLCSLVRQIMKGRRTTGAHKVVVLRPSLIESVILERYWVNFTSILTPPSSCSISSPITSRILEICSLLVITSRYRRNTWNDEIALRTERCFLQPAFFKYHSCSVTCF